MPSMVLVGDVGSHWGPPVAFGGPQMALNTCVGNERFATVRGNGSGRWCAAPTCAPLAELSLPTTQGTYGTLTAAPGARAGVCGGLSTGANGRPRTVRQTVRFRRTVRVE